MRGANTEQNYVLAGSLFTLTRNVISRLSRGLRCARKRSSTSASQNCVLPLLSNSPCLRAVVPALGENFRLMFGGSVWGAFRVKEPRKQLFFVHLERPHHRIIRTLSSGVDNRPHPHITLAMLDLGGGEAAVTTGKIYHPPICTRWRRLVSRNAIPRRARHVHSSPRPRHQWHRYPPIVFAVRVLMETSTT